MPLAYEDVLDRWDRSRAFGDPRDLPTFSAELNQHTGTNDYDAGLPTGFQGALKRGFTRAEQNVFNPIASVTTEPVGRQIGKWFGNEELGAKVGRSIPEVAAFTIPAAAAEVFSGGAATPVVAPLGAALTGSLFGAKTYADTGSPTAAAISGVTGAVLPGVSKIAGKAVEPFLEGAAPYVAKAARFGVGQAAQVGTLETSSALQAKTLGQPFDPLDPEFIATQIPFTALDLAHTAFSKPAVRTTTTAPVEKRPEPTYKPPPSSTEDMARVDAMLSKLEEVMADPLSTPQQKEAVTAAALNLSVDPKILPRDPSPMEDAIAEQTVSITGRMKAMPNGNLKILVDPDRSDVPGLTEHRNVFVNDNANAQITTNPDGTVTVKTPFKSINHNVTSPLEPDDFHLPDPNQPSLPVQPKEFQGFTPDEQRTLQSNGVPTTTAEQVNEPGGVAARAQHATNEELVNMVKNEGKPSALLYNDSSMTSNVDKVTKDPTEANAVVAEAQKRGLVGKVITTYDGYVFPAIGKDQASLDRLVNSYKITGQERWIETGRALGYSEKDIQGFVGKKTLFKELSAKLDETQATIDDAKTKIATQPQTAEGITSELVSNPVSSKYSPALKFEDGRVVSTATGDYEHPMLGHEELLQDIASGKTIRGYTTSDGRFLSLMDVAREEMKSNIDTKLKQGATPTQAVEDVRVAKATKELDDATQQQNILREQGKAIATAEPKEPKGVSMRMRGKVVKFDTEAQAADFLENIYKPANPTDTTNWTVATRGEGDKAYSYIRQRTGGKVSFEAGHGEGETAKIENLLAADEGTVTNLGKLADDRTEPTWVPPDNRPDISKGEAVDALSKALQEPAVFARAIGLDGNDPLNVIQATRLIKQGSEIFRQTAEGKPFDLKSINDALKKVGTKPIADLAEAQQVVKIVGTGVDEFNSKLRNFYVDNPKMPVPDKELLDQIGIMGPVGLEKSMRWFVQRDDSGLAGQLMHTLVTNNIVENIHDIKINTDPKDGFNYDYGHRAINIPWWPSQDKAQLWGRNLAHEFTHAAFRDLYNRDDPAAIRLKASLTEALEILRYKGEMPQKVKEAITKSLNQGWYDDFIKDGDSPKYFKRWKSVVGTKHNEWLPVFYAMHNGHELIAQMFSHPKVADLLAKTQMPNRQGSVLSFFSRVWNRIFGGGAETDTVLGQLIHDVDNYFAGTKVSPLEPGKNYIPVERYGTEKGSLVGRGYGSVFFAEPREADNGFGEFKTQAFIPEDAKIYRGDATSYGYLEKAGLMDKPHALVKEITGNRYQTPRQFYDDQAHDYGDDMHWTVSQQIAAEDLKSKGYQGAKWEYEDDLIPRQYQIWDKSILKPHVGEPMYNARSFMRDYLVHNGVEPKDLPDRLWTAERLYSHGDLNESITQFEHENPDTKLNQNLRDALAATKATGAIATQAVRLHTMGLLMDELPAHQELYWQMKQDLDAATSVYKNIQDGHLPGAIPLDAPENLKFASVKLSAMKRALDKQTAAIDRFMQLNNFTLDGQIDTFSRALQGEGKLPAPPDPTGLEDDAHALLGIAEARRETSRGELEKGRIARVRDFIIRNLMVTQYAKRHVPGFEPVADHVFQNQGDASARMSRLNFVRGYDPETQDLSKKIIQINKRVEENPNLAKAASDIRRWIQIQNKEGKPWTMQDPFVKYVLGRSGDPEAIKTELQSELRRREDYVEQVTPRFLQQLNQEKTAYVIAARETGMKPDVARDLSADMYRILGQMTTPENIPYAMQDLRTLATKMQPDTFMKALELSRGLVDDSNKHIDFMRKTPGYVTEQRFDDHHLVMVTPDGKPYRASFKTQDAAKTKLKSLESQGYTFLEYVPKSDANVVGGLKDDVISSMKELDSQWLNRAQQALSDKPELLSLVAPMITRATDYEASQQAFSPVPGGAAPRRKFIGGREEINMVTNNNLFYIKANNWMRHKLMRATSDLDFLDPDLQGNRASLAFARQHVDNQLTVDNQLARKLVEATYNWKLAWNFGVNFLHGIQSLTSGMASLISETGGVGDAYALTGKAIKSVIGRATSGKWDDPKLNWLANKLVAEGHAGIAGWSDIYGDQLVNMMDSSRNNNPLSKGVGLIKNAARNWTGMFLKFNDQIGAISGFMLGKERGMSDQDAYNFAIDVKNRAYYTGGKAQRAVGLWSIKSKPVPQLVSSLQTYTYGWFSQLMSNYIRGFGKAPEGLTASERIGAKKAFLYQLGAQAVMAGALGLPGVGQGIALAKQASGVDIKAWLRQHMGELFGEDQDNGGLMTMLALHGAVASVAPFDPSGRHIPTFPFIGVSPYKGFDVANLASAPVSAASDVVRGLMAAAKGDISGAGSLLPHVLSGPFNLFMGEGDVRDKSGGLVTKLSPADRVITALGMTPTRVTVAKDTANAAKQASQAASQEKSRAMDKIATTYRMNGQTAGQALVYQWFKDHPDENQPAFVRSVASKVTSQTVPVDWRRGVNVAADLSGLSSRMPSTEVLRQNATDQTAQSLGLFQRRSGRSEALAQQLDDLMNSDPTMSRAGALQELSGGRPSRSRYSVLPPAGYQ